MRERGRSSRAAGCTPADVPGPPWRRSGHRRYADWPPGAVIASSIFHLAGSNDLAERGGVHLALSPPVNALLLVGPVALFWRRRAPMVAFVTAAAASIAFATHADPHWMYAVAPGIALFTLAKQGRPTDAAIGSAVAWAGYLLVTVALGGLLDLPVGARPDLTESLLAAAGLGGAVLGGTFSRAHHERMVTLARAREDQQRAREEQRRAQEEQNRRKASEERLRIAQELHDVLGHHLSLINVQAGVGLHLMDNRPEQAREALSAIKTASAEALREVRSVLGVLRTDGEAAPRQPALGLNRLDDLTADAGFPVRTRVDGEPRELPAEVDRAAYRIVQEALTNVRRHAGPEPTALVEIRYVPGTLLLSISNTGRGDANPGGGRGRGGAANPGGDTGWDDAGGAPVAGESGSGIAGMRARAETLGGSLTAGPGLDGGYLVSAVLPTSPPAEASADRPPVLLGSTSSGSNGSGGKAPGSQWPGSDGPAGKAPGRKASAAGAPGDKARDPGARGPGAWGPESRGPGARGPEAWGPEPRGPGARGPEGPGAGRPASPLVPGPDVPGLRVPRREET